MYCSGQLIRCLSISRNKNNLRTAQPQPKVAGSNKKKRVFNLKRKIPLPKNVYNHLKGCGILKSRGVRSGKLLKRKI